MPSKIRPLVHLIKPAKNPRPNQIPEAGCGRQVKGSNITDDVKEVQCSQCIRSVIGIAAFSDYVKRYPDDEEMKEKLATAKAKKDAALRHTNITEPNAKKFIYLERS